MVEGNDRMGNKSTGDVFFYVAAGSRNWRKTQVYLKKQKLKKKKIIHFDMTKRQTVCVLWYNSQTKSHGDPNVVIIMVLSQALIDIRPHS